MANQHFQGKTLLGIDYGTKVVGLALYCQGRDPFILLHGRILYQNDQQVISELKSICLDEGVDILVLGLPHFTDGKESQMTIKVKQFGQELQLAIPELTLFYQDETLSTYEAEERMKNSPKFNFKVDPKQIDSLCASVILEDFLAAQAR